MNEKIRELINKSKIKSDLKQLKSSSKGKSYFTSYPHFKAFFLDFNLKENREELLYQGANMVYGWMPTILDTQKKKEKYSDLNNVLKSIKSLGDGDSFTDQKKEDLKIVAAFMNNSIVGASKLLHFIYPEKYPIWDSKICKIITGKSSHQQVQKITNYIKYYEAIHNLFIELPENLEKFKKEFKEKFDYKISTVRAAELLLFLAADD
jgi:hypothetical protein